MYFVKQLRIILTAFIFLIAFSVPFLVSAQDTAGIKHLTLQEAIDLSIKNSKQLKASQARIDEATGALNEAKDNRLPNASVGATGRTGV